MSNPPESPETPAPAAQKPARKSVTIDSNALNEEPTTQAAASALAAEQKAEAVVKPAPVAKAPEAQPVPTRPKGPSPTEQANAESRAASAARRDADLAASRPKPRRRSVKTEFSVTPGGNQAPKTLPSFADLRAGTQKPAPAEKAPEAQVAASAPDTPRSSKIAALPRGQERREETLARRESKAASAAAAPVQPAQAAATPEVKAAASAPAAPVKPALVRQEEKRDLGVGSMSASAVDMAAKRAASTHATSPPSQAAPAPKPPAAPAPKPDAPKPDAPKPAAPKPDEPKPDAPAIETPAVPSPSKGGDTDDDKKKDKNFFLGVGEKVVKAFSSTEGMIALVVVATLLAGPVAGLAVLGAVTLAKSAHAGYKASKSGGQEGPSQGNSQQQKDGQGKAQGLEQERGQSEAKGQGQEASKSQGMSKATKGALIAVGVTACIGTFFPPAFLATGAILAGVGAVEAGKATVRGVKKLHSMNMNRIANNRAKAAEKAAGQGQSQGLAQAQSQSQGKGQEATQAQAKPAPSQGVSRGGSSAGLVTGGPEDLALGVAAAVTVGAAKLVGKGIYNTGAAIAGAFKSTKPPVVKVDATKQAPPALSPKVEAGEVSITNPMRVATTPSAKSASPHPEVAEARRRNSLMSQLSFAKAAGVKEALTRGGKVKLSDKPRPSAGPAKAATKKVEAGRG